MRAGRYRIEEKGMRISAYQPSGSTEVSASQTASHETSW